MKKSLYTIFSILLLCSLVAFCCLTVLDGGNLAYADTENGCDVSNIEFTPVDDFLYGKGVSFEVGGNTVYLYRILNNGAPIGVRFRGYYFGYSGIQVFSEVYSSEQFKIDFDISDLNAQLSASQLARRNEVIRLFSEISLMIDAVDGYANTIYDGSGEGENKLPLSDVYRYNVAKQYETVEISYDTYRMLELAREMYDDTNGAFNPAVYRLVDLWGFSSRVYTYRNYGETYDRKWSEEGFSYPLPEEKYIDAFSDPMFTNFSQDAVTLEKKEGKYFVTKNVSPAVVDGESLEQWIDLGGIAKGYAVDLARQMIAKSSIDRYYVNAGSSSIVTGLGRDGGKTNLNMENAFASYTNLLQVQIGKSSVSTSGQNMRRYSVDGVDYAHIIDGATGAPAQTGVKSVMVVVPEEKGEFWATKGDCLTTALTVMGRDAIVDFVNGYLKDNDIKIVVQYQTLDNRMQLLSNFSEEEVTPLSDNFGQFGWALKFNSETGKFYYDADAKFDNPTNDSYKTWLIVIGSLLGAAAVALVVYHFVRGKSRTATNVQNAKKDKPFKVLDVMVYVGVVLVILVLFYVFLFDTEDAQMQIINVIDEETGETLYVYNVIRREGYVNTENKNGWTVDVKHTDEGVEVTFTREIDGEPHFNTMLITLGRNASVKMIESVCGYSKECVRNFPAIERSGGSIICSPNRLKVITQ
ncbi:MAG: FAD:protein FMN transferase [Clostridiales bacterium]|nr:FAD:protein FMN transferase [Clostridiales bacterium]